MKLILASLALSVSLSAFADEEVIANNVKLKAVESDPYSQLCVAALKSDEALVELARELDISRDKLDLLECNGLALQQFVDQYAPNTLTASVNN